MEAQVPHATPLAGELLTASQPGPRAVHGSVRRHMRRYRISR